MEIVVEGNIGIAPHHNATMAWASNRGKVFVYSGVREICVSLCGTEDEWVAFVLFWFGLWWQYFSTCLTLLNLSFLVCVTLRLHYPSL